MEISKATVGVVAALCVAAGAGGAYVATRGGEPPSATVSDASLISPDPAAGTVEQSEAIVSASPTAGEGGAPSAPVVESWPTATRTAARSERAPSTTRRPRQPVPPIEEEAAPAVVEQRLAVPPALEPARAEEPEPVRPPEPPAPQFEELVVAADSVVGLQVETSVTSERARVEDEVVARVTRDVRVGDRVAIPAGTKAHGEVTLVERGGRLKDRARLGIRFTSVVLADGTRIPLETETIYREGSSPGGESAAKIGGGAIGGAIIGGILGGAKGAAIGGSVGAGAGSAAVMAGGRNPATLPSGTPITVRVTEPTTVTVEK
jgi:hypothetical protein